MEISGFNPKTKGLHNPTTCRGFTLIRFTSIIVSMMITIERAYGEDKNGMDVPVGFDIFVDGAWGNRFRTLRECKEALALDGIQYNPTMRKVISESAC